MYRGALPCCCCDTERVGDSSRSSPGAAAVQVVPCLGAASRLGWSWISLCGTELLFSLGGGKSRAGSAEWGAGGVFVCVLLYDCA